MKQLRATSRTEKENIPTGSTAVVGGIITVGVVGAVEGILFYLLVGALTRAEVWSIDPRPLQMISAGIAINLR
jgi:hypothetical protein